MQQQQLQQQQQQQQFARTFATSSSTGAAVSTRLSAIVFRRLEGRPSACAADAAAYIC
jgi:hypothetical protein